MFSTLCRVSSATLLLGFAVAPRADAQTVYSNNFEANTNGFSVSGTSALPTNSAGFGVSPTSSYLGRFSNDTATLSLSGLTTGTIYTVEFDLFIGATWDGAPGDVFQLDVNGGTFLVNASFGNFGNQSYSDTNPTGGGNSQSNPQLTGAEFFNLSPSDNFSRYGIYQFSKGVGNPNVTFQATATTAQLNFRGTGLQGVTDEYWAVDNLIVRGPGVSTAPEPGALALLAFNSIWCLMAHRRRAH